MTETSFRPGFRISATDIAFILIGAVAAAYAVQVEWWMGAAIAFVIGHFFLFCNVLRAARPLELAWSGVFSGAGNMHDVNRAARMAAGLCRVAAGHGGSADPSTPPALVSRPCLAADQPRIATMVAGAEP